MNALREFLLKTQDLQALYFVERLQEAYPKLLRASSKKDRVEKNFKAMAATDEGLFVLIDYLNFKHEGILLSERYQGEGWGLLQVLENMESSKLPLDAFIESAQTRLLLRVHNAPHPEVEEKYLKGWFLRLSRYKK